jgi:hypothetical protein
MGFVAPRRGGCGDCAEAARGGPDGASKSASEAILLPVPEYREGVFGWTLLPGSASKGMEVATVMLAEAERIFRTRRHMSL